MASEGGKIGPDLSKVGERRSERDLLEAVIVPSASMARGYESHVFRTADGRTLTGLVVRETAESLFLRTSDQREIRLRRSDIEEQKPSDALDHARGPGKHDEPAGTGRSAGVSAVAEVSGAGILPAGGWRPEVG